MSKVLQKQRRIELERCLLYLLEEKKKLKEIKEELTPFFPLSTLYKKLTALIRQGEVKRVYDFYDMREPYYIITNGGDQD